MENNQKKSCRRIVRGFTVDSYGNIRISKLNGSKSKSFKLAEARRKASKYK